jgi:hypothetical protein
MPDDETAAHDKGQEFGRDVAELLELRGFSRQCETLSRIGRAIDQVCGFSELEAAIGSGDRNLSPAEQRVFVERLRAPLGLVKEILTTFDLSVEEAKQFLRYLNLRDPEKLTAQAAVTDDTIQSFARQVRISAAFQPVLLRNCWHGPTRNHQLS